MPRKRKVEEEVEEEFEEIEEEDEDEKPKKKAPAKKKGAPKKGKKRVEKPEEEEEEEEEGRSTEKKGMDISPQKSPEKMEFEMTNPPKKSKEEGRLIIRSISMTNFKSYAGTKEIGPFHHSFSSIVGPNG